MSGRILVWFSCGAASAVAAKKTIEKYPDAEILYCDTLAYEHPDNVRFMADVSSWIGKKIKILKSEKYSDIYDVFYKTKYLVGPYGARCTTELKKVVRKQYQKHNDTHVFGYTCDESHRIDRLGQQNPELKTYFPLFELGITKSECFQELHRTGIALPAMYRLGYNNNNCIGCVKGGSKYWSKIKKDFPEHFSKMAACERDLGISILKKNGERLFLDELPEDAQMDIDFEMDCGVLCEFPEEAAR